MPPPDAFGRMLIVMNCYPLRRLGGPPKTKRFRVVNVILIVIH